MRNLLSLCVVLLALAAPAAAQSSPFLPDPVYRVLANEVSGDISYEHVRWFTHWHRPTAGSEGFEAVARYIEQKAKDYGLEDVRRIHVKSDALAWKVTSAELRVVAPFERRLAYSPEVQLSVADGSRAADIKSAELVDVGEGAGYDYAAKPVSGKVVLTSGPIAAAMNEAVWAHGALGVVAISTARATDYPDQLAWMRIPEQSADGTKKGTFAFVLSPREGQRLRREMAASKTPLTVSVKIDAGFSETPFQSFVEAVIRGTEIHDQDIVLTGHIQEERFSANDDGSGLANVLEIGRALKKAIDEGRLPRPKRDIRFWWCDEIGGEEQFFALYPDERKQILANINQDMVGALQSAGSRVQFVTREPWSRASFLGDVVESIIVALVAGNTGYLSPGQVPSAGFPRRRHAGTGTELHAAHPGAARHARAVRRAGDPVPQQHGLPGLQHGGHRHPRGHVHQLAGRLHPLDGRRPVAGGRRRSSSGTRVAIAGMAWFLATAGDAQVPLLATHMYGRALERMSRDARLAMEFVEGALPAGSDLATGPVRLRFAEAHDRAARLVREAARRERRAIESVRALVSKGSGSAALLDRLLAQLPTDADAAKRLGDYVLALAQAQAGPKVILPTVRGGIARPAGSPAPIADQVPSVTSSVKTFLELRGKLERPRTLHPLMQYEALNFADGKRTVREVFEALAAEADAAGDWYYGTVHQADVEKLFESAVKTGIVNLTAPPAPIEAPRGKEAKLPAR